MYSEVRICATVYLMCSTLCIFVYLVFQVLVIKMFYCFPALLDVDCGF